MKLPKITREELYNSSTKELYELAGKLTVLTDKVNAELIARGDY